MISDKFPHFVLVDTSKSNCCRLILLIESYSYRIRNDDHINNTTTHCNNLKPYQKVPECGARLNKEAKLHFLYTKSHLQKDMLTVSKKVQNLFVTFFVPKAYLLRKIRSLTNPYI